MEDQQQQEADLLQYMQDGDIQVRDTNSEEEEDDEESDEIENDKPTNAMNDDLDQFMPQMNTEGQNLMSGNMLAESVMQGSPAENMMYEIEMIRQYFKTANFNKALSILQNKLMSNNGSMTEEEITFYNECLVYAFFKLKEFQNAKILAEEMINKLSKQVMFSISDNDEEIPFPYRYLLATSNFELKHTKEAFRTFYKLIKETEDKMRNKLLINSDNLFEGLALQEPSQKSPGDDDQGDDDFGVFVKQKPDLHLDNATENELKDKAFKLFKKEQLELFGLFPPKDNLDSQYIMLCFEVTRMHQRQQDYRNAYQTMIKCAKRYPNNPYVLSKFGRLCLEIGRKQEAIELFNTILKMMKETSTQSPKKTQEIDTLLANNLDQDLEILCYMNKGFVNVFDGNYKDAIENFRKILNTRPANIIAANNIATCQIFCNETLKAIESIEKLIKVDPKKNLNEQVVQNLMSFYEIQYPFPNQQKNILAEYCSKQAKDNVNAAVYVQARPSNSNAPSQSSISLSQSQAPPKKQQ